MDAGWDACSKSLYRDCVRYIEGLIRKLYIGFIEASLNKNTGRSFENMIVFMKVLVLRVWACLPQPDMEPIVAQNCKA